MPKTCVLILSHRWAQSSDTLPWMRPVTVTQEVQRSLRSATRPEEGERDGGMEERGGEGGKREESL